MTWFLNDLRIEDDPDKFTSRYTRKVDTLKGSVVKPFLIDYGLDVVEISVSFRTTSGRLIKAITEMTMNHQLQPVYMNFLDVINVSGDFAHGWVVLKEFRPEPQAGTSYANQEWKCELVIWRALGKYADYLNIAAMVEA